MFSTIIDNITDLTIRLTWRYLRNINCWVLSVSELGWSWCFYGFILFIALVFFGVFFCFVCFCFVSCAWCCLCLWIAHSSRFSKIYLSNSHLIKRNKIRITYIQIYLSDKLMHSILHRVIYLAPSVLINHMLILWFTLEVHEMISILNMTFYVPPLRWLDNRKRTAKVGVKHQLINIYQSHFPFRLNSHFRGWWKVLSSIISIVSPRMLD